MGAASAGGAGLVSVANSALFNEANSEKLTRTFGTPTDNNVWTYSVWFYSTQNSTNQRGLLGSAGGGNSNSIQIAGPDGGIGNKIRWMQHNGAAFAWVLETNELLRDIGWYHLVFACDTGQATAANRCKIYLNGTQITSFSTATYPSSGLATDVNTAAVHTIGTYSTGYADMYLAEEVFIDGTQYAASDFGEFDETGLYWTPKSSGSIKSLTFGTNGFYLDNTTNAQTDASGNGNNWTNVNSVVTSTNTPTNIEALFNPINYYTPYATLSNGNKKATGVTSYTQVPLTLPIMMGTGSGIYYLEVEINSVAGLYPSIGISPAATNFVVQGQPGNDAVSYSYLNAGTKYNNSSQTAYGASFTAGDVLGVLLTESSGEVEIYKQTGGTGSFSSQGVFVTSLSGAYFFSAVPGSSTSGSCTLRIDDSEWGNGSPPASSVALNTTNIAEATTRSEELLENHFQISLVNHNGTSTAFTLGWNADTYDTLFCIKNRDTAEKHFWVNGLRGYGKYTSPNQTGAEVSDTNVLSVSGTTITLGSTLLSDNYVVTCWRAGEAGGVSNTDGDVTSTVSVNAISKFSLLTYVGNGGTMTFGHGMGTTVGASMINNPSHAGTQYIGYIGYAGSNQNLYVATTGGLQSDNIIAPQNNTSTVIGAIGGSTSSAESGITYMAVVWGDDSPFWVCTTWEGNANDNGAFAPIINSEGIPLQPYYVLGKSLDAAGAYQLIDGERDPSNVCDQLLTLNTTAAEVTASNDIFDMDTGGIKQRKSGGTLNTASTIGAIVVGRRMIDIDGRIIAGR